MARFTLAIVTLALVSLWSYQVEAQVSLSFTDYSLESGTDLQTGAVYRFENVAPGLDALVRVESIRGGALLVQIDDPGPSTAELQPLMTGVPDQDPRVDLSITLVSDGTSTAMAVPGLEISALDIDGSSGRHEFVVVSGAGSITFEGPGATSPRGPSELTVLRDSLGTRILGPATLYNGIDPTRTQIVAVAAIGSTSRLSISIGQTGTVSTAGIARSYSLDFRQGQIVFDDPVTTVIQAQIGASLGVGAITHNPDGTFDIPLTFHLRGYADAPLCDVQVVNDLTASFGVFVPSGPLSAGQYRVGVPVIGSLTGGAVLSASNSNFDGSSDQNLLALTSGDRLPVGGSAQISVVVTWFPPVGVTSTTNQGAGRGDISEDGVSDGTSIDMSHAGLDPDPEGDGPSNNSSATGIDLAGLPVELVSFEAVSNEMDVLLSWETQSETGNVGFDVEHAGPVRESFEVVGFVRGSGNSSVLNRYDFSLHNLLPGRHRFRLRQIDESGSFSYSGVVEVELELAERFKLIGAYPNPFNPSTSISFSLREAGNVELAVFDLKGRLVRTLASGNFASGTHEVLFEAGDLPSGVYVYRLSSEAGAVSSSAVLLK